MRPPAPLVALCLLIAPACDAAPKDAKPDAAAEQPEARTTKAAPESPVERAERLQQRANAFAAMSGADSLDKADWPSIVFATGLSSAEEFAVLFAEGDEMGAGPRSALATSAQTIANADYEAEGKRAALAYAKTWDGSENCVGTPIAGPRLANIPKAVVDALSPALLKRLEVIRQGAAFDMKCDGGTGVLVLGESGMVVAMEPLRAPLGDELELPDAAENRFVGYMNQPEEE